MDNVNVRIGHNFKTLREKSVITAYAVAHRAGTCQSAIVAFEQGKKDVRISTLIHYLWALNFELDRHGCKMVTLSDLFRGVSPYGENIRPEEPVESKKATRKRRNDV